MKAHFESFGMKNFFSKMKAHFETVKTKGE